MSTTSTQPHTHLYDLLPLPRHHNPHDTLVELLVSRAQDLVVEVLLIAHCVQSLQHKLK